MRVTKGLFFVLAALVGILALAAPVNAQVCEDPDKIKFKDGAACITDLKVKWNELVTTLILIDNQLNVAISNIEDACDELGIEDSDVCEGGTVTDPDYDNAHEYTADAIEDLDLAQSYVESAAGIIADFQAELAGFAAKVDGAGTDYGFRDRNRTSAARTAALIDALIAKALDALGDATTGTGVAGYIASAMTDLEDAAAELSSDGADEDTAAALLATALSSANQAHLSKDRTLRKQLSQVKRNLDKLASLFKIAMNNPRRAAEGFAVQNSVQTQVYTLGGQLISVGPAAALDRNSLANGVYVVAYSNGRVEKLVVLH